MRDIAETDPELVTAIAVAKEDYYKKAKYVNNQCRLYTLVPFGLQLAMAPATQAYTAQKGNILDGPVVGTEGVTVGVGADGRPRGATSAQGVSFHHFGSRDFWHRLCGRADATFLPEYATCADDMTFVFRLAAKVGVSFQADCTSFDLTQTPELLGPVVTGMERELEKIDPTGAHIWASYYRERNILFGQCLMRTGHMGPSGTPLQSEVNNVIATVFAERVRQALLREFGEPLSDKRMEFTLNGKWLETDERIEQRIAPVLTKMGAALGLSVRMEGFSVNRRSASFAWLARYLDQPVSFLGY